MKREMQLPDAGRLRLAVELAYWRLGWRLPALAVSLAACVVVWLFWLPMQASGHAAASAELSRAREEGRARPIASGEEAPLETFRRTLSDPEYVTSQLRVIYHMAQSQGLTMAQIDMRRQTDPGSRLSQLQVSMPVRGNYLAIRRFCADLLVALPSASIDQISLRRENIENPEVEAQIALSIWQHGEGAAQ